MVAATLEASAMTAWSNARRGACRAPDAFARGVSRSTHVRPDRE